MGKKGPKYSEVAHVWHPFCQGVSSILMRGWVEVASYLELTASSTPSSLQAATPTMMLPPRIQEFLDRALEACILDMGE